MRRLNQLVSKALRTRPTTSTLAAVIAALVALSAAAGVVGVASVAGAATPSDGGPNFDLSIRYVAVDGVYRDRPHDSLTVTQGQPVVIGIAVENTGDRTATREVTFTIDGFERDSFETTLAPGETLSYRHFSTGTDYYDVGEHEIVVSTGTESKRIRLVVEDPAANTPPTADAGSDLTVEEGTEVTLDATGSSDPDGSIVKYQWEQTDGYERFFDADTATPTVLPEVVIERTFTYEVTVTDDDGATDTDTVNLTATDIGKSQTIRVEGDGSLSTYAFATSGVVLRGGDAYDSVSESYVDGAVRNGTDSYEVIGDVEAFTLHGDASVYTVDRNGTVEAVDPADYDPVHTLRVEGTGSTSDYGFATDGRVLGGGDAYDSVSESTVDGAVRDWSDTYLFTGNLRGLSVDGDAAVSVDGETVDPADYERVHTVEIVGSGSYAAYEFSVSGVLGGGDAYDSVSGSTADGAVRDWIDTYRFTGEITSLGVDGDATVLVDGEPRTDDDPSRLAPIAVSR